jgi:hypothetical protein
MKSIITSFIFLTLFIDVSFSQTDFRVIKVNGNIVLKTKGISLETGTVFSDKEDLLFRSEDATAAVINSQKGRLVLTSRNHDLSAASSNNLPSMYNISSRSSSLLTINDLSNHFSGKYVVLERQAIELNKSAFPMDKEHFFFLRYIYKGEEINKRLSFSADTLIIDKKSLFTVDGNPIPSADNTSIKIFYRNGTESVFINQFDLIFPDMKQLGKETKTILDEITDKPAKAKAEEIDSYISEFYGKIYRKDLTNWLNKNYGFKIE